MPLWFIRRAALFLRESSPPFMQQRYSTGLSACSKKPAASSKQPALPLAKPTLLVGALLVATDGSRAVAVAALLNSTSVGFHPLFRWWQKAGERAPNTASARQNNTQWRQAFAQRVPPAIDAPFKPGALPIKARCRAPQSRPLQLAARCSSSFKSPSFPSLPAALGRLPVEPQALQLKQRCACQGPVFVCDAFYSRGLRLERASSSAQSQSALQASMALSKRRDKSHGARRRRRLRAQAISGFATSAAPEFPYRTRLLSPQLGASAAHARSCFNL